jgi:hypothetical protein
LRRKQSVRVFPKLSLCARALGSFGFPERQWMNQTQWKVSIYPPDPSLLYRCLERGVHLLAVRTLKVRIFDDRDGRIRIAADMIAHADRRGMQPTKLEVAPKGGMREMEKENSIQ